MLMPSTSEADMSNCSPHLSALHLFSAFIKFILLFYFSESTPLHWSSQEGHLEVCRLLLQCNADTEAKDNQYLPPLIIIVVFYEAKLYLSKLIRLLSLSQGTPLHWSARDGRLEICRLLLQCNADIEAKDRE
jgi:ankyrin repeat protein